MIQPQIKKSHQIQGNIHCRLKGLGLKQPAPSLYFNRLVLYLLELYTKPRIVPNRPTDILSFLSFDYLLSRLTLLSFMRKKRETDSLFRSFTVEVFIVVFRFSTGMMDNAVPVIRRRVERIELKRSNTGIDNVVIRPSRN